MTSSLLRLRKQLERIPAEDDVERRTREDTDRDKQRAEMDAVAEEAQINDDLESFRRTLDEQTATGRRDLEGLKTARPVAGAALSRTARFRDAPAPG